MAENKTANKQAQKPVFTKEKGRGTVKAVLSGDTVIVLSVDKSQQGTYSIFCFSCCYLQISIHFSY